MNHTPGPYTVFEHRGIWHIEVRAGESTFCHLDNKGEWSRNRSGGLSGRSQQRLLHDAKFIATACSAHEGLVKALQGVLHHHAAVQSAYQLPESLVRQITNALATIEKGD